LSKDQISKDGLIIYTSFHLQKDSNL
jgi:hypothetical protein